MTGEVNGNAMTPSSRVSAINIVGDLLRKVGVSHINLISIVLRIILFCIIIVTVVSLGIVQVAFCYT